MLFLEIQPGDASEFSDILRVEGVEVGGHLILRSKSPAIPNAIAALLLYIRDQTGVIHTSTSGGPRATRSPTC